MTIDSLPSGIIPTGPQDGRIRATPGSPQSPYSTAPSTIGPISPSDRVINITPASKDSGLVAVANHGAHRLLCSWCGEDSNGANLHVYTGPMAFVACASCLLKVIESVLGPRKTP